MGNDILIIVVGVCIVLWFGVAIAEMVYNGCKRYQLKADNLRLLKALSELCLSHEGWEHGIGRCVCEPHENAREAIRKHHELGEKI